MTACAPLAETAATSVPEAGAGAVPQASSSDSAPAWFPQLLKALLGNNALLGEATPPKDSQEKEPDSKKGEALGTSAILAAPVPAPPPPAPAERLSLNLGVETAPQPAKEDGTSPAGAGNCQGGDASATPVQPALLAGIAWLPVAPESGAAGPALPNQSLEQNALASSLQTQAPADVQQTEPAPAACPTAGAPGAEPPGGPETTSVLAFAARLTPLPDQSKRSPASERPGAVDAVRAADLPFESVPASPQPNAGEPAELPIAPVARSGASSPLRPDASREDKPPESAPMLRFTDTSPASSYATLARETLATAKSAEPSATAPETHRPAAGPVEPPSPVAAHSPVRDIRLQVGSAERHADIRLTERAGEVHVAVRTPDARLAGALRDDLPALAARLEATGFRAEAWHPGTTASETRLAQLQAASAGTPSDGTMSDRHGGQEQQSRERPKAPNAEPAPESQPKDFSWLMSSLR